jgi:hypothetical protein
MFPFPYTGLRLVHDEKVRVAMELARSRRRKVPIAPKKFDKSRAATTATRAREVHSFQAGER